MVAVRDARERTIAILSEHFAGGVLDVDEFERRVSLAHTTDSVADIELLVRDLPAAVEPRPVLAREALVPMADVQQAGWSVAIMGGAERKGRWTCPRQLRAVAFMGGVTLDFREARMAPGVTEVTVIAIMGGAEIIVPPGLAVDTSGLAIMGGFESLDRSPTEPDPQAPLLRVRGLALMGGFDVQTRLHGETERDARKRRRQERKQLRSENERKQLGD